MESTLLGVMALIFVLGMWWKLDHDKKKSQKMKPVHPSQSR